MFNDVDIWALAAGLGLFLVGINFLEEGLQQLAGRKFKLLLREQTQTPLRGIFIGIISTMILQSSSAVTLMLLALVGARILSFKNALSVIIGSNLGTTFTGWVVSTIGFEFDLEKGVLPALAIGAFIYLFSGEKPRLKNFGQCILGAGLVFFGLMYMKDSMAGLGKSSDLIQFSKYGLFFFAFVGFVFTAIVQSSSATMVIALTALNAQLLTLHSAGALVIGADLGTTMTALIGSIGGSASKRQVAWAHISFNVVTDLIALVLLKPLFYLIQFGFGIVDPLMSLVVFHSGFNVVGIVVFLPFLDKFSRFIQNKVLDTEETICKFISIKELPISEVAIDSLSLESNNYLDQVIGFLKSTWTPINTNSKNYNKLKKHEGLMISYAVKIQQRPMDPICSTQLEKILRGIREMTQSAKSLKDIEKNIFDFSSDIQPEVYSIFSTLKKYQKEYYRSVCRQLSEASYLN